MQNGDCKSFLEVEGRAKKGDASNQYLLGDLYHAGLCIKKDDTEAIKWLQSAATQNYKPAFFDLGTYYAQGIGAQIKMQTAFHWFSKAADVGDQRAYGMLASMYADGEGITANNTKALKYALLGAEIGDIKSQIEASKLLLSQANWSPVESYKCLLIAQQSNSQSLNKSIGKAILELDKILSTQQIDRAQKLAEVWKPKDSKERETKITLPIIDDSFADNISQGVALSELNKLKIGKDRLAFFQSIEEDNIGLFKLFIKAGASIESMKPISGDTPLYCSVSRGSKKVFDFLVLAGVNINAAFNEDGDSPILIALSNNHYDIAEKLLSLGARVSHPGILYNAVESDNLTLLEKLYKAGANSIEARYAGEQTALMNAVSGSRGDDYTRLCFPVSTQFLLEKGANPNLVDNLGNSIIDQAIISKNPDVCVSLLLKYKASPNKLPNSISSPLFAAVMTGNADIVSKLLDYGSNANERYSFKRGQIPMIIEKGES